MDEDTLKRKHDILEDERREILYANGLCIHCEVELDPTGSTIEFPDCNTWTCPSCGNVEPELGSLRLSGQ